MHSIHPGVVCGDEWAGKKSDPGTHKSGAPGPSHLGTGESHALNSSRRYLPG